MQAYEYQLYRHDGTSWILQQQSDDRDELDDAAKTLSRSTGAIYGMGRKGDMILFRLYEGGVRFIGA